jgi:hypothetical protein
MADPPRKQVHDAMLSALQASTAFKTVSDRLEPWWDWGPDKFPLIIINSGPGEYSRLAYLHPTESDMQGIAEFDVHGYVFDLNNVLVEKREEIRKDIQKVLINSTGIHDKAAECMIVSDDDDGGQLENYGGVNCKVRFTYFYNHLLT